MYLNCLPFALTRVQNFCLLLTKPLLQIKVLSHWQDITS